MIRSSSISTRIEWCRTLRCNLIAFIGYCWRKSVFIGHFSLSKHPSGTEPLHARDFVSGVRAIWTSNGLSREAMIIFRIFCPTLIRFVLQFSPQISSYCISSNDLS